MSLETGSRIPDLVPTNPVGATDFISSGDDHIRLIKACLQGSFPSLGASAVALSADQINDAALKGATQTVSGAWTFSTAPTMAGTNISALNASNLSTGTVPDARFPATLPALNGSALTNLNASNLASGTVANARLSAQVPLTNAANTFSEPQAFAGTLGSSVSATGMFVGCLAAGAYPGARYIAHAAPTNAKVWESFGRSDDGSWTLRLRNDALSSQKNALNITRTADAITSQEYGNSTDNPPHVFYGDVRMDTQPLGYRNLISRAFSSSDSTAATDAGKMLFYSGSGGHTLTLDADLPSSGGIVTIMNGGSAALTIAASGTLSWMNGSGTISTGNRTLAVGGIVTARHASSGDYHIWGAGLS